MAVHVVIMAGGSGTRFWPKSSSKLPKQFLKLASPKKSLIQQTFDRAAKVTSAKNIWVVTHKDFISLTKKDLRKMPTKNILAEPEARNTMAAVCFACFEISKTDPNATFVFLPADHHVGSEAEFAQCLKTAIQEAEKNKKITIVGIKPSFPSSGFGYIEKGQATSDNSFVVKKFHEKPSVQKATEYIQTGDFFWNGGIFIFTWPVIKAEIQKLAPNFFSAFEKLSKSKIASVYKKLEQLPFDVAIMEKTSNAQVVPGNFVWSDVGSWPALLELNTKGLDQNGNMVSSGDYFSKDSTGNLVDTNQKFVALLGVQDLIVIETKDAILVCHSSKAQEIKDVVSFLKTKKKTHQKLL